ncbi:hypothetical protein [Neotamlana laminarinivorans]|uniref:Uncharacterized protein n=1 Tax=Neotamlana laminarinivorans TaxID=2883124 RepID=A0A9X1HYM8_9FLAO|nr:hypothetical protein [Tamlana laminarinivorans]MCB4798310.1 hypothetical protein [Tamlana laminarinivorans]
MSNDLQPSKQSSEEVDLGQLFKMIGNVFNRFINFIASIFKGIYKVILLLLINIYKRFLWYAGAIIIGFIVGFIIDSKSDKLYGANMFIETNFKSARQVYENIKQFNQLAKIDKDSLELAKILNISVKEASKLKGFYIQPDIDENVMAEMYSQFYTKLDSTSRSEMNFKTYKESLTPYNFSVHLIGVASLDKYLYKKIENNFVKELSGNQYLQSLLSINQENLDKEDKTLSEQISKTDSLVDKYLEIRINESQKEPIPGSGTNLYMGSQESSNLLVDESEILDKRLKLEKNRREVNLNKIEKQSVINVLAGFPKTGYYIEEWYDKSKFLLPLVLFGLTFIFFLLLGLKKHLDSESKKLKI